MNRLATIISVLTLSIAFETTTADETISNLLVPNWATTNNGLVRYEMVSLTGSSERPDLSLFAPPAEMAGGTD